MVHVFPGKSSISLESTAPVFVSAGQRHRGEQGGRGFGGGRGHGRGRGGKRRSFEKPQKKDDEIEDETLKRTHTRFDEDEPSPKKIKTEEAED